MSRLDLPFQDLTIGLIGYGEVGRILAEDLRARVAWPASWPRTSSWVDRMSGRWSSTPPAMEWS
jgi:hypothetical protein